MKPLRPIAWRRRVPGMPRDGVIVTEHSYVRFHNNSLVITPIRVINEVLEIPKDLAQLDLGLEDVKPSDTAGDPHERTR